MEYYCKHGSKFDINKVTPHIISYLFNHYLPDEIWYNILTYIDNQTLVMLALTNKILYKTIKSNVSSIICKKCPAYIKFTASFVKNNRYVYLNNNNNTHSYPYELYQTKIIENKPIMCIKLKFIFT